MSTMVIDFKSDIVDSQNRINEDGTLTLNLDEIFKDRIVHESHTWEDGRSGDTFALEHFSTIKIASGRTMHRGVEIYDYYSFGGWDKGSFNRIVDGGELVEGPHAYAFAMGVSLTAHKQADDLAVYLEVGDKVILGGALYKAVPVAGNTRIDFELVAAKA